jgi:ribosomal protein S18 acetylase RimI-like enzyme
MTLVYSLVDAPAPADTRVVDAGLGAANAAGASLADVRPLACFARTPAGAIIGGAVGRTWGECCELQQLWVDPAHRRQGVGRELVRNFAAGARTRQCRRLYLETFSFQAPAFYRALGFSVALEIRGFTADTSKFTLLCELT